jgi:hypothetical protein
VKDDQLRVVAKRLDLQEKRCPLCIQGRTLGNQRCCQCDGTGRLWKKPGARALTDERLQQMA